MATAPLPGEAAELLSPHNVRGLFDSVDAFLFDCDGNLPLLDSVIDIFLSVHFKLIELPMVLGVIWKGDTLIEGVSQTLEFLRSKVNAFLYAPIQSGAFAVIML